MFSLRQWVFIVVIKYKTLSKQFKLHQYQDYLNTMIHIFTVIFCFKRVLIMVKIWSYGFRSGCEMKLRVKGKERIFSIKHLQVRFEYYTTDGDLLNSALLIQERATVQTIHSWKNWYLLGELTYFPRKLLSVRKAEKKSHLKIVMCEHIKPPRNVWKKVLLEEKNRYIRIECLGHFF